VAAGLTVKVPPVTAKVLLLPSDPVTVTAVAFVAATVNVEEAPAAIEVGLAVMVTVGAVDEPPTVTVAVAVAGVLPDAPFAVAVYVVVLAGVTLSVPPVAAIVLLEPSDPVTVTLVAFVAVTVNVEEAPAAIDVGLAMIVTVGAVDPGPTEPQPASTRSNEKVAASGERIERKGRETRTLIMGCDLPVSGERQGLGFKTKKTFETGRSAAARGTQSM